MNYETTLQLVRDLSEGKLKREPGFVYKPPPDRVAPVITPPVAAPPAPTANPEPEPKKPGYMELDYASGQYVMEDLNTHSVVFRHTDGHAVRQWARENGYQLL